MTSYKDNDPKGWCGDPKRGAALGRPTIKGELGEDKVLNIIHKPWVDGDYDENGTYFGGGNGDKLYWVSSEDGAIDYMLRANNLYDARSQVMNDYPDAKLSGDKYDVSLDDNTLQEILNSECDSFESPHGEVNDEIRNAAKVFESKVLAALEIWVGENIELLIAEDFKEEDVPVVIQIVCEMSGLRGGAGYLYYMEHQEAGIGTLDGDWDYLVKDQARRARSVLKELSKFVKKATHDEFVTLHYSLVNRALEGFEEDDEEDTEEKECS